MLQYNIYLNIYMYRKCTHLVQLKVCKTIHIIQATSLTGSRHDDAISLMKVLVPHIIILRSCYYTRSTLLKYIQSCLIRPHTKPKGKGARRSHRSDETKHLFTPYDVAVGSRPLWINYDYPNRKFCCYVKKCNMNYCAAGFFQFLFN
jgi:hypothetical protein